MYWHPARYFTSHTEQNLHASRFIILYHAYSTVKTWTIDTLDYSLVALLHISAIIMEIITYIFSKNKSILFHCKPGLLVHLTSIWFYCIRVSLLFCCWIIGEILTYIGSKNNSGGGGSLCPPPSAKSRLFHCKPGQLIHWTTLWFYCISLLLCWWNYYGDTY